MSTKCSLAYGLANSPRDEQIEQGKRYFRDQRERQSVIKEQIETLKKLNSKEQSHE